MVIKKMRIKQRNPSNGYDVLHPETTAEQVIVFGGGTLATQLDGIVNVKSFGAMGDGLTDDTVAIQNALNSGRHVIIPSGIYLINAILRVPSNTKVIGLGESILKRNAEISAIMINDADGITGGYTSNRNIKIENIAFDANNSIFTTHTTSLFLGHCEKIEIQGCKFINCKTWHDLELNAVQNCIIRNCEFPDYQGTTEMIQLDFAGSSTSFPWFGPYDNTCCQNITIEECDFNDALGTLTCIGNHSFLENVIMRNICIRNNVFNNAFHGINLGDVISLDISDNLFKDTVFAITFVERKNNVRDWKLINNTYLFEKSSSNTDGRFFYGQTSALTKEFHEITIVGNNIHLAKGHGIGFTSTGKTIIANNNIRGCGRNGIFLYGGTGTVISSNSMTHNNSNAESNRADIVIGNAPIVTANTFVTGNDISSLIIGTNVVKATITNNQITNSITNNSSAEGIIKNNIIGGVWSP